MENRCFYDRVHIPYCESIKHICDLNFIGCVCVVIKVYLILHKVALDEMQIDVIRAEYKYIKEDKYG